MVVNCGKTVCSPPKRRSGLEEECHGNVSLHNYIQCRILWTAIRCNGEPSRPSGFPYGRILFCIYRMPPKALALPLSTFQSFDEPFEMLHSTKQTRRHEWKHRSYLSRHKCDRTWSRHNHVRTAAAMSAIFIPWRNHELMLLNSWTWIALWYACRSRISPKDPFVAFAATVVNYGMKIISSSFYPRRLKETRRLLEARRLLFRTQLQSEFSQNSSLKWLESINSKTNFEPLGRIS